MNLQENQKRAVLTPGYLAVTHTKLRVFDIEREACQFTNTFMVTAGYLLFPTGRLEQERSLKREQEISLQKAIENDRKKLVNIIFQRIILQKQCPYQ